MYDYFIGIDPGMDGAIVVLKANGDFAEYCKMPVLVYEASKRKIHIYALFLHLKELTKTYGTKGMVCIEKINGSPGQGATAIFAMGHGCGVVETCVCLADLSYEFVGPQKWKNRFLAGSKKEKDASVTKALELFPKAREWCIGPRGGRDHNIADAMFIAEYSRNFFTRSAI